ncbi:MAG TPA: MFS transporter [Balneolales bacterium]|nr:MFS transporter [Balneolales bacterium]
MNRYIQLFKKEWKILLYGLIITFFSSFGQTFFISLFVPVIIHNFHLTKTGFGTLYAGITLLSAINLSYFGRWIDRMPLKTYGLFIAGGLICGSLLLSLSWFWLVLGLGLLLVRFFGQGLSSHASQTAMSRYFDADRGTALSIASLGFPLGEGILPGLITILLSVLAWRWVWASVSLFIVILLVPLTIYLLHDDRFRRAPKQEDAPADENGQEWHYRDIIKDSRFYYLFLPVLLPPFLITGLFLYQISFAHDLGWSAGLIATAFISYAISRVIGTIVSGPVIDRFTATRIFPYYLIPFGIALAFAYWHPGDWSAFVYMFFVGITMGTGGNIKSALYAELYGVRTIGTVRSLFQSLMVFSTAISPFLMGWLLDHNIAVTKILLVAIAIIIFASLLSWRLYLMEKPAYVTQ